MLELARKADSVELKLTVPAADHRTAIAGLGLDPLEAQIRQVFFFDTPQLTLNAAGRRRARAANPGPCGRHGRQAAAGRTGGPPGRAARCRRNLVVEVDAMPGGYVCSATLKAKADATDGSGGRARRAPDPEASSRRSSARSSTRTPRRASR